MTQYLCLCFEPYTPWAALFEGNHRAFHVQWRCNGVYNSPRRTAPLGVDVGTRGCPKYPSSRVTQKVGSAKCALGTRFPKIPGVPAQVLATIVY